MLAVAGLLAAGVIGPAGDDAPGGSAGASSRQSLADSDPSATDLQASRSDETDVPKLREAAVTAPNVVPRPGSLPGIAPAAKGPKPGGFVPFVPVFAELPSGRRAAVDRAGVDRAGTLQVPEDVTRLAWWTGGAQAGDPYGGVVLAGHVDSRTEGIGTLAELRRLRAGQQIVLTGAHGQEMRYRVQRLEQIPKVRLAADGALFAQARPHRLVMITCGGPFDRATHRYRDNLVLLAAPERS